MAYPPASILVPAYNYASFLGATLDSALAQDYAGELEILVVDDGSTDDTAEVLAPYLDRVRYHKKANAGLSAARNTAMELAAHDRVVFLDADDLLEPHAVRRLSEAWDAAAAPPVVAGARGRMIDATGEFFPQPSNPDTGQVRAFTVEHFILRNRFAPIVMADRRVLLELGGFEPALKASEDRDMWIRACTRGPVVMLEENLYRKRDHGANMSRHAVRQTASILQVLARARSWPGIEVEASIWREAEAICLYQSARMHLAAGDRSLSIMQCFRSVLKSPWLFHAHDAGFPAGFRLKFLLLGLAAQVGLGKKETGLAAVRSPLGEEGRPLEPPTML